MKLQTTDDRACTQMSEGCTWKSLQLCRQNINSRIFEVSNIVKNFWARTRWVQKIPIIFYQPPSDLQFFYFFETTNGLWPKKGDTIPLFHSCLMLHFFQYPRESRCPGQQMTTFFTLTEELFCQLPLWLQPWHLYGIAFQTDEIWD